MAWPFLMPPMSYAADSSGNYAVWGVGKKACFAYNKESADGAKQNYRSFINGFLTAYNIFTDKTYSISGKMNKNQIDKWLRDYCQTNPVSSLENALIHFIFDHYEKRTTSSSSANRR